jgi:hypothetical protein
MLTESFPVEHKTLKKLGAGICVGATTATSQNENGQILTTVLFIILWENNKMPSPHTNAELLHLTDHEKWFSNYFDVDPDDLDDDEGDDEDENESNYEDDENTLIQKPLDENDFANVEVLPSDQGVEDFDNDNNLNL